MGMGKGVPSAFDYYDKHWVELLYPWHWHAFNDLTTERQIGMAAGPIPASAVTGYARDNDLNPDETWVLQFTMRVLDIHHMRKQHEREAKKST